MDAADGDRPEGPLLRIGELARRAGIPPATLRAWERRYAVVQPLRGDSGYRLYTERDERALRRMVDLVSSGLAPAEAARRIRAEAEAEAGPEPAPDVPVAGLREALAAALADFDDRRADVVLDRAVTVLSTDALLEQVMLPVLRELEEGTIGREHFASNLIRGRMLALARGWGGGSGPRALLACPSGERHDLGLIAFGLALRDRGWRVAFLGADTPIEALRAAAEDTLPQLIALCAMDSERLRAAAGDLRALAARQPLVIGGPGATDEVCAELGARHLAGGPVAEAAAVAC